MLLGFDLINLITTVGYVGLFIIIFSESGLLIGLLLPGDSLLFTAGFLASQGYLNITTLVVLMFVAAVSGDSFGYFFGRKIGHRIFTKEKSLLLSKDHIQRSERFFEKHGPKAIIIARFTPVIRTLAPILAGVGKMKYSVFIFYNILGGLIWGMGIPISGYYLGQSIPNIDQFLIPIIVVVVVLSSLPTVIHLLKSKQHRQEILQFFGLDWKSRK